MIFQSSNENVPNVREACVKAERDIAMRFSKVKDQVKKHLQAMVEDADFEVRNSAIHALENF